MENSMITGNPSKVLIRFAIPLALANLLQQLYNIADTIIIGKFISSDALAAVGNSTNITFLLLSLSTGFGMGTSIIISQYFGAKDIKNVRTTIYTGLITSLIIGIFVMSVGLIICKPLILMINTPTKIVSMADSYLRIYLYGIIFLFTFNIYNSIFQALGDSKTPFIILGFSTILNIVMDLILVCKFRFGIEGAAWATFFSELFSLVFSGIFLRRKLKEIGFDVRSEAYSISILKKISMVAIPSVIQHSIMSISSLVVQALISSCGAEVIAGYTAAVKIDSLASSPIVNIGGATSTFSAQNVGAGEYNRVKEGVHSAIVANFVISAFIVFIAFAFGNPLIGLFVKDNSSKVVISVGVEYLRIACLGNFLQGFMHIYGGILRGTGDIKGFLIVFSSNLISRAVFAYLLYSFFGETGIWLSVVIGWFIGSLIGLIKYKKENWMKKRLI